MSKYTFGFTRIFEKTAVLFVLTLKILTLGLYLPSNWKLSLKAQLTLARASLETKILRQFEKQAAKSS